ncbi:hypothetical protein LP420_13430 [Massilia sp. B-10]|nr:hypothetical protein LP420_13430 [Massilia sp. B-10]
MFWQWSTALRGLAQALLGNPQQKVASISCLPEQERTLVLDGFNATSADFPRDGLIHQLFEEQARLRPDAVAIEHDGVTVGYGELNRAPTAWRTI